MIHLSACDFKRTETDKREQGVAILTEPGTHSAVFIIAENNKILDDQPWDFNLWPYRGAISIPTN